tara:strand:+ start:343 stop:603 length:261 start_codon:yes stop_codon:yes gene_type:complete
VTPGRIDGDAGAKDELALTSPGRGETEGVRNAAAQCSASAPASDGRGVVGVDDDGCKVGARGVCGDAGTGASASSPSMRRSIASNR